MVSVSLSEPLRSHEFDCFQEKVGFQLKIDTKIHFWLRRRQKNMANRTQICNVNILIEETLSLLKARGIIKNKINYH